MQNNKTSDYLIQTNATQFDPLIAPDQQGLFKPTSKSTLLENKITSSEGEKGRFEILPEVFWNENTEGGTITWSFGKDNFVQKTVDNYKDVMEFIPNLSFPLGRTFRYRVFEKKCFPLDDKLSFYHRGNDEDDQSLSIINDERFFKVDRPNSRNLKEQSYFTLDQCRVMAEKLKEQPKLKKCNFLTLSENLSFFKNLVRRDIKHKKKSKWLEHIENGYFNDEGIKHFSTEIERREVTWNPMDWPLSMTDIKKVEFNRKTWVKNYKLLKEFQKYCLERKIPLKEDGFDTSICVEFLRRSHEVGYDNEQALFCLNHHQDDLGFDENRMFLDHQVYQMPPLGQALEYYQKQCAEFEEVIFDPSFWGRKNGANHSQETKNKRSQSE